MKWQVVETKKGTRCRVLEGGSGAPVVFFHGAGGLLRENPYLDGLAQRYHVYAPEWPGYGDSTGEELLEDMVPIVHGPADISVIVVGGAGKHSSWQPTFGDGTHYTRREIALPKHPPR